MSNIEKASLLPDVVKTILQAIINGDYQSDVLSFLSKDIDDSMIPEICEQLTKTHLKFKTLNLSYNQITTAGALTLLEMLKTTNLSVKQLDLNHNKQINDNIMNSLGEYIKEGKTIEGIWLCDTQISDAGIEILAPYLDGNTTLKRLFLSGNKGLTEKSIPLLIKMVESSYLYDLGTASTSIAERKAILVPLACNRIKNNLASLVLFEEEINDDDIIKICDAMKKYGIDQLKDLNLELNIIRSKGASVLFNTLREFNSVVSQLNLGGNQIDDDCMKQLGEFLQDNEYLEMLKVSETKITDYGVKILSEYLIGNTKLKQLDLSFHDEITENSIPYLIEIAKKSVLTQIELWGVTIPQGKQNDLYDILRNPIDQREIPIKSNTKSAAKIQ